MYTPKPTPHHLLFYYSLQNCICMYAVPEKSSRVIMNSVYMRIRRLCMYVIIRVLLSEGDKITSPV